MSAVAIEGAGIPQDRESFDSTITNQRIEDLSVTRVVFFAGDEIPSHIKYSSPQVYGFGGIHLNQFKTLPKQDKGMLYRCKLTAMKPAMIDEWSTMLSPEDRKNWDKSFVQSNAEYVNGEWKDKLIDGFTQSNPAAIRETGQFATKKSDHIVFKKRYPGEEIGRITERSIPHGAGGVVEISALKGATMKEIAEAQLFFFPNWKEIMKGEALLPFTVRELEDHIKTRIKAAMELEPETRNKYQSIGQGMLRSCTEFRNVGLRVLQMSETIIKDAATKGFTATYPPVCELWLDMLEQKRKDDLAAGESSSVDRLARIMEAKEASSMLLEERKQYLAEVQAGFRERDSDEEVRLGIKKVANPPLDDAQTAAAPSLAPPSFSEVRSGFASVPPVEEVESVTTVANSDEPLVIQADVRTCGAPTASGTCKRALEEGQTQCWQHGAKSE